MIIHIMMIQIHNAGWSVPRTGNEAETSITEITFSIFLFFFCIFIILYFPLSLTEVTIFGILSHQVRVISIKCAKRKLFFSTNTDIGFARGYVVAQNEETVKEVAL